MRKKFIVICPKSDPRSRSYQPHYCVKPKSESFFKNSVPAEKRRVSPYNAIWWCRQQTLRKLMKNMTRKSWIFWNWQSLPELSDLEKSDLKIRSRSVKKRSTIRSRSWSRKMVESDLRSDQKVICRSRSWSVDQDRHYFDKYYMITYLLKYVQAWSNCLHKSWTANRCIILASGRCRLFNIRKPWSVRSSNSFRSLR